MGAAAESFKATVIGGGPAGLMAAEVLAQAGLAVTVYEHMASLGRKLQLAGRGGLNITHSEPLEAFLDRYGPHRTQLEAALRAFTPEDLRAWCAELGETTFVGSSGRVFPESFRATPLLRAWLLRLSGLGVSFEVRHRWQGWSSVPNTQSVVSILTRPDGEQIEVASDVIVMALGGASWPRVGSDGGWVKEFSERGIEVNALRPSNCGVCINWSDHLIERFAGTPLKNVSVTVAGHVVRGDAMLTRSGLEGGPIYAHSPALRNELDRRGACRLTIDLHPDLSHEQLSSRLTQRRRPKDSLSTWLRRSGLDPLARSLLQEVTRNEAPHEAVQLAVLVKAVPLEATSLMPIERAISTAGGVAWAELDGSFMLQRMPGTFVAGEMIDWEAPTGGYLLQGSFSTAVAAAKGAVVWLHGRA